MHFPILVSDNKHVLANETAKKKTVAMKAERKKRNKSVLHLHKDNFWSQHILFTLKCVFLHDLKMNPLDMDTTTTVTKQNNVQELNSHYNWIKCWIFGVWKKSLPSKQHTHISLWWQFESEFNDYVNDCYNARNNNLNIAFEVDCNFNCLTW